MIRLVLALVLALAAGCATNNAYVEAQKAALVRESEARVAEAQAIAAVAGRLDAGGAAAYAVAVAMRHGQGAQVKIERPRDWLDYLHGVTAIVGSLGNIAVPIVTAREAGKTSRAGFDRDVRVEEARQTGETGRVTALGAAMANLGLRPTTSITVTAGGDSLVGSGTIDRRDCRVVGGAAGPGGAIIGPPAVIVPGGSGGSAIGGC